MRRRRISTGITSFFFSHQFRKHLLHLFPLSPFFQQLFASPLYSFPISFTCTCFTFSIFLFYFDKHLHHLLSFFPSVSTITCFTSSLFFLQFQKHLLHLIPLSPLLLFKSICITSFLFYHQSHKHLLHLLPLAILFLQAFYLLSLFPSVSQALASPSPSFPSSSSIAILASSRSYSFFLPASAALAPSFCFISTKTNITHFFSLTILLVSAISPLNHFHP